MLFELTHWVYIWYFWVFLIPTYWV